MDADEVRAIVREEINRCAPIIMAHVVANIAANVKRGGFGYRRYEMQDGREVETTFTQ